MAGTTTSAVIEVDDLVKTYGGGTRAVDQVSFGVEKGELFGFLGPNGAGKTTTIRILATLLKPTSGRARIAGFDVVGDAGEVRRRLGLAMQTPTLDAFSTGRETLELAGRLHRMPAREVRARADELLRLMGLEAAARKLTGTYSGGMKRRLDLAAALMHRPEVLILDEPTEGLDPQSRTALWEELERINAEGTTMLLTTHYMEEADRLCTRLAIIDGGRVVVDGTPETLKAGVGADTVVLRLGKGGRETTEPARRASTSPVAGREDDGAAADALEAELCRLLEGMVACEAVAAHDGGVTLSVPDASTAIPALLRRLDRNGLDITGLHMSRPSLDDVFLKYTGRHIREEAADQPIILGF
jgi:ABC-2 type transport system ATP-binding protein